MLDLTSVWSMILHAMRYGTTEQISAYHAFGVQTHVFSRLSPAVSPVVCKELEFYTYNNIAVNTVDDVWFETYRSI